MTTLLFIGNDKRTTDRLTETDLLALPADIDPHTYDHTFFNLLEIEQVRRIINDKIDHIDREFSAFYAKRESEQYYTQAYLIRSHYLKEELIYWLKVGADKLIALYYFLDIHRKTGAFPEEIAIHTTEELIEKKSSPLHRELSSHLPFLKRLNEIMKAHKHASITCDIEEPHLTVYLKSTNLKTPKKITPTEQTLNYMKNNFDIQIIKISDLLAPYNVFYQDICKKIR